MIDGKVERLDLDAFKRQHLILITWTKGGQACGFGLVLIGRQPGLKIVSSPMESIWFGHCTVQVVWRYEAVECRMTRLEGVEAVKDEPGIWLRQVAPSSADFQVVKLHLGQSCWH